MEVLAEGSRPARPSGAAAGRPAVKGGGRGWRRRQVGGGGRGPGAEGGGVEGAAVGGGGRSGGRPVGGAATVRVGGRGRGGGIARRACRWPRRSARWLRPPARALSARPRRVRRPRGELSRTVGAAFSAKSSTTSRSARRPRSPWRRRWPRVSSAPGLAVLGTGRLGRYAVARPLGGFVVVGGSSGSVTVQLLIGRASSHEPTADGTGSQRSTRAYHRDRPLQRRHRDGGARARGARTRGRSISSMRSSGRPTGRRPRLYAVPWGTVDEETVGEGLHPGRPRTGQLETSPGTSSARSVVLAPTGRRRASAEPRSEQRLRVDVDGPRRPRRRRGGDGSSRAETTWNRQRSSRRAMYAGAGPTTSTAPPALARGAARPSPQPPAAASRSARGRRSAPGRPNGGEPKRRRRQLASKAPGRHGRRPGSPGGRAGTSG